MKDQPPFDFAKFLKVYAEKNEAHDDGEKMVEKLRENMPYCALTFVFALKSSGDIGFVFGTKFPIRKYNVI